jgi:SAM-dependent methyltransferase
MKYILTGSSESRRLDAQVEIPQFSLARELAGIALNPGTRVLDAGCGSGVLCRHLEATYRGLALYGCDRSKPSLDHARATSKGTTYFVHDFIGSPLPGTYDVIFNRLVAHHLTAPLLRKGFANFFAALATGGELVVIDPDGLLLNIGTTDDVLRDQVARVSRAFEGDLQAARLIPPLLRECGFRDVTWRIDVMDFQGEARRPEVAQWKERFENSLPFYVQTLGTELEARRFFKRYLEEASRDDVPLFYNKFIVRGTRP